MPNELLPTNIQFGTVVGRFGSAPLIAGDADGLPDFSPAAGLTVTFTPSTAAVIDATASPAPVTIEMVPIVCGLDTQGYLVGGDGQRGVKLIATNDTDINPSGWTYSVTFLRGGSKVAAFRDFSMSLPAGVTKDIALTIPVPSSEGVSLSQAQAAEAAAVSAASQASVSAASASSAASAATTAVSSVAFVATNLNYAPRATGNAVTDTANLQAAFNASANKTCLVPAGNYKINAGLTLPRTASLTLDPGTVITAASVISGAMLTVGDQVAWWENKTLQGGTWNCADLAADAISIPFALNGTVRDFTWIDPTRHGLIVSDPTTPNPDGAGTTHGMKISGLTASRTGGSAFHSYMGSYGIWMRSFASDNAVTDCRIVGPMRSIRNDGGSNTFTRCHGFGDGYYQSPRAVFSENGAASEYVNCVADTPMWWGWEITANAWWWSIKGGKVLLNNSASAVVVGIHTELDVPHNGTILGVSFIGGNTPNPPDDPDDSEMATDYDGIYPSPGVRVHGCISSRSTHVKDPKLGGDYNERLAPVAASQVTQGLYQRTKPTPVGAAAGLRVLARDPLVDGRIWAQSQTTAFMGYSDDHGATWVSKFPIPAGASAGVQGLYFVNGSAWILQGPGSVGRDGSLWKSPYPDANGNGWNWTVVFDLANPPAGITPGPEAVMRCGIFAAEGPNLYLGEYCGLPQITGGPSLYYSPDSGQNWTKVKQWANARHIHEIRVINGVPWVTLGDASAAWTDVGLWAATTPQATTWNRASVYGEAVGGNTLYGIGFLKADVGGIPSIILASDTRRGMGPLVFTSQTPTQRRVLNPLSMVPPAFVGTMFAMHLTSEGNLMWYHSGESGSVGNFDSICISKGPHFTETVILETQPAVYPPFGGVTGPGDPVEDGPYIWIAGFRIRKELFTGQVPVTPAPVPVPAFVPNPPLTITNQWIAPSAGADGDVLPSWTPTTGAVALAQATAGSQPTLVTTSGTRYVRFDGVDDFLSGLVAWTQPATIFIKAKVRTYNGVNAGLIYPNGSGFQAIVAPTGAITVGHSLVYATPSNTVTVNTDFTIAVVYNSSASRVSINGGTPVTGDVGSGASNDIRVGYAFQSGSAKYAAIDVREIRVYRQVLTTAQVNTVVASM